MERAQELRGPGLPNVPTSARRARNEQRAAEHAADFVEPGMVVGLGSGLAANFVVRRLGELVREEVLWSIVGVPSSPAIAEEARAHGIPLATLSEAPVLDLVLDGADEIDPALDFIQSGADLLHTKILAQASVRTIVVADDVQLVPRLGTRWPVPVEVVPFALWPEALFLESIGAEVSLRRRADDERPLTTAEGNLVLDATFGPIADAASLAAVLDAEAGIVAHGLFVGLATEVVVAGDRSVRHQVRDADEETEDAT